MFDLPTEILDELKRRTGSQDLHISERYELVNLFGTRARANGDESRISIDVHRYLDESPPKWLVSWRDEENHGATGDTESELLVAIDGAHWNELDTGR